MKTVTIKYDTYMALLTSSGSMQGALQAVMPQLLPHQQDATKNMVEQAKVATGNAIAEANTTPAAG